MQAVLGHNNILRHRQTYIRDIENKREAGRSRGEVEPKTKPGGWEKQREAVEAERLWVADNRSTPGCRLSANWHVSVVYLQWPAGQSDEGQLKV